MAWLGMEYALQSPLGRARTQLNQWSALGMQVPQGALESMGYGMLEYLYPEGMKLAGQRAQIESAEKMQQESIEARERLQKQQFEYLEEMQAKEGLGQLAGMGAVLFKDELKGGLKKGYDIVSGWVSPGAEVSVPSTGGTVLSAAGIGGGWTGREPYIPAGALGAGTGTADVLTGLGGAEAYATASALGTGTGAGLIATSPEALLTMPAYEAGIYGAESAALSSLSTFASTSLPYVGLGLVASSLLGVDMVKVTTNVLTDVVKGAGKAAESIVKAITKPFSRCIIVSACCGDDSEEVNIARKFRDDFMDTNMLRGYYILADNIVPFMERNSHVKQHIKTNLVDYLIDYGRNLYYGDPMDEKCPIITQQFLDLCSNIGKKTPVYVRSNGEVY